MKKPVTPGGGKPKEADLQVKDQKAWARWLERHHHTSQGVWLVIAKKGSGLSSPTYHEALEEALCFGWVDGQKGSRDEQTWAQRFCPRGPRSIWSKINVKKAEELIAAGRMRPSGVAAVEAARNDGRWALAYDGPRTATVPADLQEALDSKPAAKEFFALLNGANRYAILFRVQTAKRAETRQKRIRDLVDMLERRKTLHPQRIP